MQYKQEALKAVITWATLPQKIPKVFIDRFENFNISSTIGKYVGLAKFLSFPKYLNMGKSGEKKSKEISVKT